MASTILPISLLFLMSLFAVTFECCFSQNYHNSSVEQCNQTQALTNPVGSAISYPLYGSVTDGYYYVNTWIGSTRTRPFKLDVDTGSELTWIQCDAPCIKCYPAPPGMYKPPQDKIVLCNDPICSSVDHPTEYPCRAPTDRCHYVVTYADGGKSVGFLVKDTFPLFFYLAAGSNPSPSLAFGCGFYQEIPRDSPVAQVDGVLGLLSNSKVSIISQLRMQKLTQNVLGHCFSRPKDGYLFIGADMPKPPGTVFAPLLPQHPHEKTYSPGFGDLIYNGQATKIKNVQIIIDSGATYTYFNPPAYEAIVAIVTENLRTSPLTKYPGDPYLPLCWKGPKGYESVDEVKGYFRNFAISFPKAENVQFQLPPEAYLIISPHKNVCLGILDGRDVGDFILIGDISMQDKLVIYDNEREQIGWGPSDCKRKPSST